MAELVYIDETGSVGKGAKEQPYLRLVAVVVDESMVRPLAQRMYEIAMTHLGWRPAEFEFHGVDVWHGRSHWHSKSPTELLGTLEALIGLLAELELSVVHATINKEALRDKYDGHYDSEAYRLALQFMLEKLDRWPWTPPRPFRVLIADEAKQERVRAIKMVADLQEWSVGVVPGERLNTIIDSMHFVESIHSSGVQLADIVAYILQRADRDSQGHPEAAAAVNRMAEAIGQATATYRMPWPPPQAPPPAAVP
ncbi:DUF3800 domain-containing protein [Krasilnikoviella flava]|uniref:DUF3800 domain-containing protein n=1 Tax=Krasilnikoviella flava TaxID=526729 RepID=UPI0009A7D9C2|nr:DUF3800 domain-containing protein [Krasilnikoviella flava]